MMVIFTSNTSPKNSFEECLKACFIQMVLPLVSTVLAHFFYVLLSYGYIRFKGWEHSSPSSALLFLTEHTHVLAFSIAIILAVLVDENSHRRLFQRYLPIQIVGLTMFNHYSWQTWYLLDVIIYLTLCCYLAYQYKDHDAFDYGTAWFLALTLGFCFYSPIDGGILNPINILVMAIIVFITQALPRIIDEMRGVF